MLWFSLIGTDLGADVPEPVRRRAVMVPPVHGRIKRNSRAGEKPATLSPRMALDLTLYNPEHPADPSPPTFWNRLRCKLHGHFFHLDWMDFTREEVHLICVRCSRILVGSWPRANIVVTEQASQY